MSNWLGVVPGVVSGIAWPAIPRDEAARLMALLFQLEQSQWLSPEGQRNRQLAQLRGLLSHARAQSPYFAERLAGVPVTTLEWDDFGEIPVMTRQDIQEHGVRMLAQQWPSGHGESIDSTTSGSSGRPITVRRSRTSHLVRDAMTLREHFWRQRDFSLHHAFVRSGAEEGRFASWGPPLGWIATCGSSASFPINATVDRQLAWLAREDPHYILTTPALIDAYLAAAEAGNLRLTRLREIRTVGGTVSEVFRDRVARVWGVSVADIYSTAELGTLAFQCEKGSYHVQAEAAILEVLRADGHPCAVGEPGRVVVTPLQNFAMPLIRYELGDYAEPGEPCACGRGLPTLRRILGRHYNRLVHPDGRVSFPCLAALPLQGLERVSRFRLCQASDLGLKLEYVAAEPLSEAEMTQVTTTWLAALGWRGYLDFCRVEGLAVSEAGKFDDLISEAIP